MNLIYTVQKSEVNFNIKDLLVKVFSISNRLYLKLLRNNCIKLNDSIYLKGNFVSLNENDVIEIDFDYDEDNSNIVPRQMSLDIVFEDDWLLVVNKPTGMSVHPSILHYSDSLSNGVRAYFDSIGLKKKIRPVNRIDRDTSGLVVFAKCEYIHSILSVQMQNKEFVKKYLAIVIGNFNSKSRNY